MILYKITNLINGRCYIGMTVKSLKARWDAHLSSVRRGSRFALHVAIRKYGATAFSCEELSRAETRCSLASMEILAIREAKSLGPGGYNMTAGGEGCGARTLSDTTRAKIGAANRGKVRTEEYRKASSATRLGRKWAAAALEKRSATKRKNGHSLAHIAALKASWDRLTDEERAFRRVTTIHSPKAKAGAIVGRIGTKRSAETRARMAAAQLGKRHTAEARAKMSATKQAKKVMRAGAPVGA